MYLDSLHDRIEPYRSDSRAKCVFYNDIWELTPPGLGVGSGDATDRADWRRVITAGTPPSGRFGHAAAVVGDNIFMFGGKTAQGASDELWMYHISTRTWLGVVQTTGVSPGKHAKPVAIAMGSSMLMYGDTGKPNDLYEFQPAWDSRNPGTINPPAVEGWNQKDRRAVQGAAAAATICVLLLLVVVYIMLADRLCPQYSIGGRPSSSTAADMGGYSADLDDGTRAPLYDDVENPL